MTDIAFAPATRLASLIRRKKIGCLELLDHYIARVEKYNPALNAIIATDFDGARKRARAADRARKPSGPFHGVPMTVKESLNVVGYPTTWGVPAFKDKKRDYNAVVVERWLNAGAVIFGKTNVPVMLADGQSFNPVYGRTNNPWDLTRTPGGSSGGSAAAIAAGISGIETGSDIASSIRNPAHNCGVFGHKPTWGIVPTRGHTLADVVTPLDISVVGPLARSAGDLEAAMSVLAGPDVIEAAGLTYNLPAPRKKALKDFKIGVVLNDPVSEVERDVQDVLQKLVDFLAKKKAKISDTARPKFVMRDVERIFAYLLSAAMGGREPQERFEANLKAAAELDAGDQSLRAHWLRGATAHHRDWLGVNEERSRLRFAWHEWFEDYDLLLCPVYPLAPHKHTDESVETRTYTINGKTAKHANVLFWAGLTGVALLPSTAAPAGFTKSGLPVGVQIVGPHFGDRITIGFAKLLEQEWQGFVPPKGFD
jgi:amidase